MNNQIPIDDLIALVCRWRDAASDPRPLRDDSYALFASGVRYGKERAAADLSELLAEYEVTITEQTTDNGMGMQEDE